MNVPPGISVIPVNEPAVTRVHAGVVDPWPAAPLFRPGVQQALLVALAFTLNRSRSAQESSSLSS